MRQASQKMHFADPLVRDIGYRPMQNRHSIA
jgi:hypothetical protein